MEQNAEIVTETAIEQIGIIEAQTIEKQEKSITEMSK